ncbi:hypothetical protein GCM10011324_29920 [Allosediminivita pacifica]|nr:hypothetical protein GCM10011324_29920 [Allosediminivita pacifica]
MRGVHKAPTSEGATPNHGPALDRLRLHEHQGRDGLEAVIALRALASTCPPNMQKAGPEGTRLSVSCSGRAQRGPVRNRFSSGSVPA